MARAFAPLKTLPFPASAPNFICITEFVQYGLKCKRAFLASQKSFGAVGKFMQSEAWPSLHEYVAVLQLCCCVILVRVVISNGPSFHSSQDNWLFPFNLVPLR